MVMRIPGPNGELIEFPDGTNAATVGKALAQLGGGAGAAQDEPKPSWWQENISGVQDPKYGALPSVYSQFPDELHNQTALAATLGASDPQMGDIVAKTLGPKVLRREKDAHGYDVFVTRGKDGQEQKAYLNRPGLDLEDVSRGVHGALPYMIGGGVGGGVARSLMGRAAVDALVGGATSVAGDIAQQPLGSEQGVEGGKALGIGILGGVARPVGRAVSNGAGYVRDALAPAPAPLASYSGKAISRLEEAMQGTGGTPNLDRQGYQNQVQNLGPDVAMLGDMTPTLQNDTARLAGMPGSADVAAANLGQRQDFAPDRLRSAINVNVGPEINLPEHIKAQSQAYNAQAKPLYDQFYKTPILSTPELKDVMARVPRGAINSAQDLAKREGYQKTVRTLKTDDYMTPITGVQKSTAEPVIPGVEYDYIKRAIDDAAKTAKPGSNEQRITEKLARELRNEVDNILSPHDPSLSPWAQARAIAGEGLEGKEAAADGAFAFGPNPRDPHLVADDLKGMTQYGQDSYRAGGRNKLRQVAGRAASNYNAKGDSATRRALNSEFAHENLRQILPGQNAQNLINRVEAENTMATTFDKAFGNSKTASMLASGERWPSPDSSKFASEAGKKGPVGLATEGALRMADALVGSPMRRSSQRALTDGARILTSTGPERDALVHALFDHIGARGRGRISAAKYDVLVQEMLRSSRGAIPQNAD